MVWYFMHRINKTRPEFSQNEKSPTTRGEMKLSAVGGWSLVSLTTVSTCRLMEVFSAEQYLCSLEGNLLEELEDTQQVFVASLVLSDVLAGGRGSNKYLFTL
jgi:hypothetical protein